MLGLIDKTRSKDIKTLLVGGKPGIAQAAAFKLGVLGITDPDIELINKIQPQLLFVALGPRETGEVDCQELAEIESEDRDGSRGSAGPSSQTVADCPKMDADLWPGVAVAVNSPALADKKTV